MRGIATIDRQPGSRAAGQPGSDTIALWVTSSSEGMRGRHVNAVVIDSNTDPDASEKLRSLTRSSLVLLTDGSTLDGLPVEGGVLTTADIDDLVAQPAGG